MKIRNWIDLSRKLVDKFDMDYMEQGFIASLGEYALAFFGEGVFANTIYPTPFPITMSGTSLGGNVGFGIAFDPNGLTVRIDPGSPTSKNFTIPAADPVLPRWDLLVIRYVQTGDTPVPKPSNPILTVFLNLHDDFALAVIPGIASATPVYPAKLPKDVILAGLRVPAAATLGTQVQVDLTVRELAAQNFNAVPTEFQERPTGVIDGINNIFTLSKKPIDSFSVKVFVDELIQEDTEWFLTGVDNKTLVLNTPPALAQEVYVDYFVDSGAPNFSGYQQVPTGVVDGVNDTFSLVGHAGNKPSTQVYLNGRIVTEDQWSLIQGPVFDQIKFNNPPPLAYKPYVFFLLNPASIGTPPAPSPGGGELTPFGNAGAPIVLDPTVSIPISNVQRQIRYVETDGSGNNITANPQIQPGTVVGQELYLEGTDNVNYVELDDGDGVSMNGLWQGKVGFQIIFTWNGLVWSEAGRNR